ncbi:MAG: hypothetical protein WBF89_20645 [Steroidobacteraceae bacterium]
MKRPILAFIVGLLTWIVVVSLIDRLLRLSLVGYTAAEPTLTFTLGMMVARQIMAAVTSLIAGAAVGAIAPGSRRIPWILGLVILAAFIPVHVHVWHALPVWYHLTFLIPLAPLIAFGAWMSARKRAQGPLMPAATSS